MKKATFLILFIAAVALLAHPPTKVDIKWDNAQQLLYVRVDHPVDETSTKEHYVREIRIEVNGEQQIVQNINEQQTPEFQTAIYRLTDVRDGDKIKVTASCSKRGKKSAEITAKPAPKQEPTPAGEPAPKE